MRAADEAYLSIIEGRALFGDGLPRRLADIKWLCSKLREVDKALLDLEGLTVQWGVDNPEKGAMLDKLREADVKAEKLKSVIHSLGECLCAVMPQDTAEMIVSGIMNKEGLCSCGEFLATNRKSCSKCAAALLAQYKP